MIVNWFFVSRRTIPSNPISSGWEERVIRTRQPSFPIPLIWDWILFDTPKAFLLFCCSFQRIEILYPTLIQKQIAVISTVNQSTHLYWRSDSEPSIRRLFRSLALSHSRRAVMYLGWTTRTGTFFVVLRRWMPRVLPSNLVPNTLLTSSWRGPDLTISVIRSVAECLL